MVNRFTGTLTSRELRFEGLTVRDLAAAVDYRDGKLTLSDLRGRIPQPSGDPSPPGEFRGTATAAIDPAGDLTASLTLDRQGFFAKVERRLEIR